MEFDDTGWKSREYIKVHDTFLVFLVEHTLSWVERTNKNSSSQGQWPALVSPEHIYTLFLFVLFNHVHGIVSLTVKNGDLSTHC